MALQKKYTIKDELEDTVRSIRQLSGLDIVLSENKDRLEKIYGINGGRVGITYDYGSPKSLLRVAIDIKDFLELLKQEGKLNV